MNRESVGRRFAVLFAALLVSSTAVGVVAAAQNYGANDLDYSSEYVQNPAHEEQTLEKATHEMGSMSLLEYSNDNGAIERLPAELNDSTDNPIEVRADKMNVSDFSRFPGDKSVSALDEGEWTSTGSAMTVSDTETAPGVEALQVSTSGLASGDSNSTTFSNFTVDSDANKRFAQYVVNVNSIESGAEVKVVASDSDGDDKVSVINASRARADGDVIANATGMGIVYQTQMGDLALSDVAVSGSGDGSFDGNHAVHIVVEGGDADVTFAGMNAEKMRTWQMGEQKADTDSDDDLETKTLTEPAGYNAVTGLDTLGSDFDSATLSDVRFPVTYSASALDADSDVDVTVEETAEGKYPNYGYKVDAYYRLTVPQQYDLVHSGLSFTDTQKMPSDRYKTVEVAEGVGENTEFSDISSWSDVTSSYSSEGANVTLDSTVEPGKSYAVHYEYVVTDSNKDTMESEGPGGAPTGGGREGGNQGIIGSIMAVIASTLGALGLGKFAQKVRG